MTDKRSNRKEFILSARRLFRLFGVPDEFIEVWHVITDEEGKEIILDVVVTGHDDPKKKHIAAKYGNLSMHEIESIIKKGFDVLFWFPRAHLSESKVLDYVQNDWYKGKFKMERVSRGTYDVEGDEKIDTYVYGNVNVEIPTTRD